MAAQQGVKTSSGVEGNSFTVRHSLFMALFKKKKFVIVGFKNYYFSIFILLDASVSEQ